MARRLGSGWVPATLVTVFGVLSFRHYGEVPLGRILAMCGWVLWSSTLPGTLIWRALDWRGRRGARGRPILEDLSLGTIAGIVCLLPPYFAAVSIGHARWSLLWPAVVLAVFVVAPGGRRVLLRRPAARQSAWTSWGLAAVTALVIFHLSTVWGGYVMDVANQRAPYVDTPFHLSLIGEFRFHFPGTFPYVDGTPLKYHWLVYPWYAASTWGTGSSPRLVFSELGPTVLAIVALLGTAAAAARLSSHRWAAVPGAASIAMFATFDVFGWTAAGLPDSGGPRWTFLSPTQSFATALCPLLVVLLVGMVRPGRRRWYHWLALAAMMFAVAGAKSAMLPLFVAAAVGSAIVVSLVKRRLHPRLATVAVLSVVVLYAATVVFYGRGSRAITLQPFQLADTIAVKRGLLAPGESAGLGVQLVLTLSFVLGTTVPIASGIGLFRRGGWRRPLGWLLLGATGAGIGAYMLLHHPSLAQYYFFASASVPISLLGALGWVRLIGRPTRAKAAMTATGLLAGLGVAWLVGAMTSSRRPVESASTDTGRLLVSYIVPLLIAFAAIAALTFVAARLGRRRGSHVGTLAAVAMLVGTCLIWPIATVSAVAEGHVHVPGTDEKAKIREGGVVVAEWVGVHSTPDQVIATNLHLNRPNGSRTDWRSFWISAYAQRRVLVEGWAYIDPATVGLPSTERNNLSTGPPFWNKPLLAENDLAFRHPTAARLAALRHKYDVHWLFVDRSRRLRADVPALKRLTARRLIVKNYAAFEIR